MHFTSSFNKPARISLLENTEALSTAEQIRTKETPLRKRLGGEFGILVACSKRPLADKRFSYNTLLVNILRCFLYIKRKWKILKTYGVPTKIIDLIKNFYEDSRCAVRCGGELGEWFRVVSGVRQGCVLSPLIFAIIVDCMDHVKSDGRKHLRIEMDRRGKAHGSGLRRQHRFAGQHMGWNKAIDGKGSDRSRRRWVLPSTQTRQRS